MDYSNGGLVFLAILIGSFAGFMFFVGIPILIVIAIVKTTKKGKTIRNINNDIEIKEKNTVNKDKNTIIIKLLFTFIICYLSIQKFKNTVYLNPVYIAIVILYFISIWKEEKNYIKLLFILNIINIIVDILIYSTRDLRIIGVEISVQQIMLYNVLFDIFGIAMLFIINIFLGKIDETNIINKKNTSINEIESLNKMEEINIESQQEVNENNNINDKIE